MPPLLRASPAWQPTSFFRPSHCRHPSCGSVRGEKSGPHIPSRYLSRRVGLDAAPGGFLGRWDRPNDLLSVPAAVAASHSLLHSPAGDRGKPGREPTHLALGLPRVRPGCAYGGSDQGTQPHSTRLRRFATSFNACWNQHRFRPKGSSQNCLRFLGDGALFHLGGLRDHAHFQEPP